MDKKDLFFFGTITKTHGKDGTFLIKPETSVNSDYQSIESVFIEINGSLVPFFVEENKSKNNSIAFKFEGIDENTTSELISSKVYLKLSDDAVIEEYALEDLEIIGFKVIDISYGDIGIVETIFQLPQQKIIQVKKGEVEILIPVRNEFIRKIEKENKTVRISAPEGLIEIYLPPSSSVE